MAQLDQLSATTTVVGIAEPHQSAVASILGAVALGVFGADEAELMIDRIRALATGNAADPLPEKS
ncbi:hypothetical protein GCM10022243_33800 [Saccharothrix violaceirubra]|uniref:Uncharacterized protein n=1 Tax=Saccharothrix violaceirubra TaxID=413306 RepID=A0A7W7T2N5_9PSEU|nr:hypothetical protein [Saccharothrix violaceirubra]MBB4964230.1 hypothetical protein [Saccharothrix violaceirubra]